MTAQNGQLTHDPAHGFIWTTNCRKCGTTQRVRLGTVTMDTARQAVGFLAHTPQECPNGYHTELGGWDLYWSLDLMLAEYAKAIEQPAAA